MSVVFQNPGVIDLDVIRLMGVNVKTGTNPIGHFGTGLKYAIAILLRTGHTITLEADEKKYVFNTREELIRGKPFSLIYMNNERLAFTTELGKEWEVWQAYRELRSNVIDEGGKTLWQARGDTVGQTRITVSGSPIEETHKNSKTIFLETEPLDATSRLEVHPGANRYLYYRGIRVAELDKPSLLTYNILEATQLTEDRTLAGPFTAIYRIRIDLPKLRNVELLETALSSTESCFERDMTFLTALSEVSDEFFNVEAKYVTNLKCNASARDMYERKTRAITKWESITLTKTEREQLAHAWLLLADSNCTLNPGHLMVVESLGGGILGTFSQNDGKVIVSRQLFDLGPVAMAGVIYRHWMEKVHSITMGSPSAESFLLQRMFSYINSKVKS